MSHPIGFVRVPIPFNIKGIRLPDITSACQTARAACDRHWLLPSILTRCELLPQLHPGRTIDALRADDAASAFLK